MVAVARNGKQDQSLIVAMVAAPRHFSVTVTRKLSELDVNFANLCIIIARIKIANNDSLYAPLPMKDEMPQLLLLCLSTIINEKPAGCQIVFEEF